MAERIECVKEFYNSSVASEVNLIVEELKSAGLLSADSKGKWSIEQFETAARALNVMLFIQPLEKGGYSIPELKAREAYVATFSRVGSYLVQGLADTFGVREKRLQRAYSEMLQFDAELDRWETMEVESAQPEQQDLVKDWKAAVKLKAEKTQEFKEKCDEAYSKWHSTHSELQKDKHRIEEWEAGVIKKAEKQRQEDIDAVARVKRALDALKKFLQGLMLKVPEIVSVVRKMGPDHTDPYTTGDMRVVYANLIERFRNNDQMGITTTLVTGMRITQAPKQDLSEFVRGIEEFHQHMLLLGVTEVSMSDLAAIVALSGMHEEHKKSFLDTESTVALTVKNLEGDQQLGENMGSGDSVASQSRRGVDKRSLLEKVLEFCHTTESKKLMLGNMSGGDSGAKNIPPDPEAALRRKRDLEARSILSIAERPKLTVEQKRWNGVCNDHKKGHCRWGEQCKYLHEEPKQEAKSGVNSVKAPVRFGPAARALFATESDLQKLRDQYVSDGEDD